MNKNLIIEIGTEELPSSYLVKLEKDLRDAFEQFLVTNFLTFSKTQVYLTPRRMVFWVEGVAPKQDIPEKNVKGPPIKIAFNEAGIETPALKGFLEKCQASEYEIDGAYVYAKVKGQNQEIVSFFQHEFSRWLLSFPYEKKMRWEDWQFVRPIRWILALYGDQVIGMTCCGIESGRITRLLRGFDPIPIESADEYFSKMSSHNIELSAQERKDKIETKLKESGQKPDEEIVWENVNRSEYPVVSEATFSEHLLVLPSEVICTVISNQLKCFPAWENSKLLPKFYFVMNGCREIELVRRGYEKVITARLNDASYFFQKDQDVPLRDRIPDLVKMTFMEKLGTLADKTQRVMSLAKSDSFFANQVNLAELISLCKADLATTMVQELTELQGTIGKIYALKQGIEGSIADGIEDHYHPRSEGDSLPSASLGLALSILDRIDTITGAHSIGMNISSSSDPLGLRRIANGLVRILISEHFPIDVKKMFAVSLNTYQEVNQFTFDYPLVTQNLLAFFLTRIRSILSTTYRYDIVNAVTKEMWENPYVLDKRCQAVVSELNNPSFKIVVDSYTRIKNITKEEDPGQGILDGSVFQKEEEIDLWESINQCPEFLSTDNSLEVLTRFYQLNLPITRFFDKILVMDPNMNVRKNRLQLLYVILKKLNQFADFSKIVFEGGDKV